MRSEIDIGYMAGLLDGEGSLNYTRLIDKKRLHVTQGCRINVTAVSNSNPLIVARAAEILRSWEVGHIVRETHPFFWNVDIKGKIDNKRNFLEIIFPALRGKREQAMLLLKFMEPRGSGKYVPITEADRCLLEQVKKLNHLNRLGSVTTARETGDGLKIQSELDSDAERPAETTGPTLVKTA